MSNINIQKELNIVIKQANHYIDYINGECTYSEFGDRFLILANNSDLKQNFEVLKNWLWSKKKMDSEDFLQLLLDFEGIMKAINNQGLEITNEIYRNCKEYWDDAQNHLKAKNSNNYMK